MADSPGRGSVHSQRGRHPPARASPASSQQSARRQREGDSGSRPSSFVSTGSNNDVDAMLMPPPGAGLRAMESRFSLHEQFATSRREFEFDDDEVSLEPAPILDDHDDSSQGTAREDEDENILLPGNERLDYYSLLGLPKDPPPTREQIRSSYYRLSLAFHPDKHPQHLKAAAERHFTRLQKAYETLIEPRKRVIYDLEGEEGVQNEYKAGGSMGEGGEAQRQIGVKTMEAEEFRKWFMNILQERERRSIEELVGSSGTCKVFLNASQIFMNSPRVYRWQDQNDGSVFQNSDLAVRTSPLFPEGMQLRQSFSVPLPSLGRRLGSRKVGLWTKSEVGDEEELFSGDLKIDRGAPKLTFTGAVGGHLEESIAVMVTDPDRPQDLPLPPPAHWYKLSSERFQISTRLNGTLPDTKEQDESRYIPSVFRGTDFDITAGLFPKRTLSIGLGRPYTLLKDTKPFYVYLQTQFNHSIHFKPPVLGARVSRSLGRNHIGYIQSSSGDFPWPSSISERLPVSRIPLWLPRGHLLPTMKIGYIWSNDGKARRSFTLDEDDDIQDMDPSEETIDEDLDDPEKALFSPESWHIAADSSPLNTAISATYGCDLFVPSPEPPVLSRIRNNGEAVATSQRALLGPPRGIRLEIEGDLALHSSFGGAVRGVRRVGEFTSIAISIGLNHQRGLYVSFSWSRLGQNIIVPVILVPEDQVNVQMWLLAVAIPWATYLAAELAIFRPWARQKRNKLIERKRQELKNNVKERRKEAEQAVQLMQPLVEHRQALERENGGLVILNANYGVRNTKSSSSKIWLGGEVVDVTLALAALVDAGQLSLARGSKSQIIGFSDPAPLKKKTLIVEYLYAGEKHRTESVGNAGLTLPQRSHEI